MKTNFSQFGSVILPGHHMSTVFLHNKSNHKTPQEEISECPIFHGKYPDLVSQNF